jgi:polynucleotide 5'-kinase involved in rRNA processing
MSGRLKDFVKEAHIVKEIRNPRNKLIMVMGNSDTGKTTLIECIADLLAQETTVGIVDLDMGQSHIGLPTTIAWGKIQRGFKGWAGIVPEDFYFTGTLTPFGSLLPSAVGAKLITDKALSICQKVVVDTTGLIAEPAGRVLKQFKIDLLSPHIILAFERSKELGHILDSFQFQKFPKIYRLPVPDGVVSKSVTKRTQYRLHKFKSYFTGAHIHVVSVYDKGVRFTKEPIGFSAVELKERVVSFRDERNRDLALGIIQKFGVRDKILFIRSPIIKGMKFSTLVIGPTKIELD